MKTEGEEKDQPPAQSPGPAILKQTEEEVDHLFEVFRAMAARAGIALPKAGGSFLPANPGVGQAEQYVVPGSGRAPPPSCLCGEGEGRDAIARPWVKHSLKLWLGRELLGWAGLGEAGFTLRHPSTEKPLERFFNVLTYFYTETAAMLPAPPRRIDIRMNHTLPTKSGTDYLLGDVILFLFSQFYNSEFWGMEENYGGEKKTELLRHPFEVQTRILTI